MQDIQLRGEDHVMTDIRASKGVVMSNYNAAEQRELRAGRPISQQRENRETGEMYWVQIKMSWGRVYFSCDGDNWYRTAKAARLSV